MIRGPKLLGRGRTKSPVHGGRISRRHLAAKEKARHLAKRDAFVSRSGEALIVLPRVEQKSPKSSRDVRNMSGVKGVGVGKIPDERCV